jgi:DNA polymerase-3 subunit epsilon
MTATDSAADSVIVLDFETTGLSPDQGERAIEIGAVKLVDGVVVDTFQQLMYPGKRINYFIENYTGITNSMLKHAPPCGEVMSEFSDFIDGFNLVAHNASFDSRFLDAELRRIKRAQHVEFACSMLIARRIYPDAPNHKLGTLVSYKNLPNDGSFHRALADSQMTAHLWLAMIDEIKNSYAFDYVPFNVMQQLSRITKASVLPFLESEAINLKCKPEFSILIA